MLFELNPKCGISHTKLIKSFDEYLMSTYPCSVKGTQETQ